MSLLTELDVVNDCLGTLGELPVNALDDDHPLIAAARRAFKTVNYREQSKQWWFNTEIVNLVTDADSNIFTPQDAIRCDPVDDRKNYIQRGRRMYDPSENKNTYSFTETSLQCWVVRAIPFEDCPPSVQLTINAGTQLKFMAAYDADPNKYRQILQEYQDCYTSMNAEHIRNSDTNILARHSTLSKLNQINPAINGRLTTFR